MNWRGGRWEKISVMQAWKNATILAATVARGVAEWPLATMDEHRTVMVTIYRVRELDEDGLVASATPIINGLKLIQHIRLGKRLVPQQGPGLIYDDDPLHVTRIIKQVLIAHFGNEKTVVEVQRHGDAQSVRPPRLH